MGKYASKELLRTAVIMQEEEIDQQRQEIAKLMEELVCLAMANGILRLQLKMAGVEPAI